MRTAKLMMRTNHEGEKEMFLIAFPSLTSSSLSHYIPSRASSDSNLHPRIQPLNPMDSPPTTVHTAMNDYFMASLDLSNVFTTSKFPLLFFILGGVRVLYHLVDCKQSRAGLLLSDLHSGFSGTTLVYLLPLLVLFPSHPGKIPRACGSLNCRICVWPNQGWESPSRPFNYRCSD